MNNINLINSDNSFIIHFSDFKFDDDNGQGYFQYKFTLRSRTFKMSTNTYSSIEELFKFKEDLKSFLKKDFKVIYFAPLGEFWSIKFSGKELDIITLEGNISDVERIQSRLEFHASLSVATLVEVIKQLEEVLDSFS